LCGYSRLDWRSPKESVPNSRLGAISKRRGFLLYASWLIHFTSTIRRANLYDQGRCRKIRISSRKGRSDRSHSFDDLDKRFFVPGIFSKSAELAPSIPDRRHYDYCDSGWGGRWVISGLGNDAKKGPCLILGVLAGGIAALSQLCTPILTLMISLLLSKFSMVTSILFYKLAIHPIDGAVQAIIIWCGIALLKTRFHV
jgi:hypothetical protein